VLAPSFSGGRASVNAENFNTLVHYLNERELIRLKRVRGEPGPWTKDSILNRYKFTNIMRSNDRTTQWLKKHWYDPNRGADPQMIAMNCAIARYFGSIEFCEVIGFQQRWDPKYLIDVATIRLQRGQKVFTGAYIITNAGSRDPKQNVVVCQFLTPLRYQLEKLLELCEQNRWQPVAEYLQRQPGIGAFMSKEIALDMMLTPLLENATDKLTWSPAGPGAIRGLNRLHDRPLQAPMSQSKALGEMTDLLGMLSTNRCFASYMPIIGVEYGVTDLQFSLCELDKYLRVQNKEGRPRSGYDYRKAKPLVF
jgi:hypothetical protein